jgi:phage shock protein PspC (stress-responsive transcriptional regulator)
LLISPPGFLEKEQGAGRGDILEDGKPMEVKMRVGGRSLRRSRSNRVLAGVCGGLEEFFGLDAFWFRLAFLIALLPGGVPGIAAYLIMWLIVPSD